MPGLIHITERHWRETQIKLKLAEYLVSRNGLQQIKLIEQVRALTKERDELKVELQSWQFRMFEVYKERGGILGFEWFLSRESKCILIPKRPTPPPHEHNRTNE